VTDAKDAHGVVFESKQNAVIAQAEPKGTGHFAVESIHIARAGLGETENPFKEVHRSGLIQRANIPLRLVEPLNPVRRHLPFEGKILGFEPELSQYVLHRNAFAASLCEPSLPAVKASFVLLGDWFIIGGRLSQGARDGIKQHELQEANRSGDL
jgi:hypothetical protein